MNKTSPSGFNHSLNGYRGFCALLVFFFHSGNAGVISTSEIGVATDFVWTSLRYGVEMFFMISGYVILGSLARHASIAEFLMERIIRIYSPWVPALVSVSVVCAVFHAKMFAHVSASEGLRLFLVNLSLLPPLVSVPLVHRGSWSLTYEWIFYLAAASGALLLRRPRNTTAANFSWWIAQGPVFTGSVGDEGMAAPLSRSTGALWQPGTSEAPRKIGSSSVKELRWAVGVWLVLCAGFVCLYPRATFFLTGVLVFQHADWFERRSRWLRFPLLSMAVFLVAWRFTEVDEAALSITYLDFLRDQRWIAAVVAFIASLHMFASVVFHCSRQLRFLDGRFFQFFGNVSYSFYLWHTLVMSVVKRIVTPYLVPHIGLALGFAVFVIASGVIALALSWASWSLFEVHVARAVHRFRANLKELQSSEA